MAVRGFEDFEGATTKALKFLEWLVIELQARHPMSGPINAPTIERMTVRHEWVPMEKSDPKSTFRSKVNIGEGGLETEWGYYKDIPGLSGREVRAMVHYLREHKQMPIASGSKGYFWAADKTEMQGTVDHMEDRISSTQKALRALERPGLMLIGTRY